MSQQEQKQKQKPYIPIEDPSEDKHQFFVFQLPFPGDWKNDDIISNGRAVFTTNTLMYANPTLYTSPTLDQWMAANYLKVKQFSLAFRIVDSFSGGVLPANMKRDLKEVCTCLGRVLKEGDYIHVTVGTPEKWQPFQGEEAKMLQKAQDEIVRTLKKELKGLGWKDPIVDSHPVEPVSEEKKA